MSDATPSESRSERRRREVAEAARRVIVRKGLEPATLRDISREGGFTTGVLSHHFPDKRAVIVGAFLAASEDFLSTAEAELSAARSPRDLLERFVRLATPDEPGRRREWRLWSEMWTYAGRDADFAAELTATDASWEALIANVLASGRDAGLLRPDVDARRQAPVLARLVDGLGIRAWLAGDWAAARRGLVWELHALGLPEEVAEALADTEPVA